MPQIRCTLLFTGKHMPLKESRSAHQLFLVPAKVVGEPPAAVIHGCGSKFGKSRNALLPPSSLPLHFLILARSPPTTSVFSPLLCGFRFAVGQYQPPKLGECVRASKIEYLLCPCMWAWDCVNVCIRMYA